MTTGEIIVAVVGVLTFVALVRAMWLASRLSSLIDAAKLKQDGEVDKMNIEYAFQNVLERHLVDSVMYRVEEYVDENVRRVWNSAVDIRMHEVAQEIANKYTQEHFTKHMQLNFEKLVGGKIKKGILRDMRFEDSYG